MVSIDLGKLNKVAKSSKSEVNEANEVNSMRAVKDLRFSIPGVPIDVISLRKNGIRCLKLWKTHALWLQPPATPKLPSSWIPSGSG